MAIELIEHNPSLKAPVLQLLVLCSQDAEATRADIESRAADAWSDAFRQSPSVCLDILVRNGALDQTVLVDGQEYEGAFEDIQTDESIPDDAEVVIKLAMTETGNAILADYDPAYTLGNLLSEKQHYEDVFRAALAACNKPEGCALPDLEAVINTFPQLAADPTTGQTRVYPQYFIDALETAGGIAWDGAWRTTDAGKALIA